MVEIKDLEEYVVESFEEVKKKIKMKGCKGALEFLEQRRKKMEDWFIDLPPQYKEYYQNYYKESLEYMDAFCSD